MALPPMPSHLHDTTTGNSGPLSRLYPPNKETNMDATPTNWKQTTAAAVGILTILGAGIAAGRCSAPAQAQETQEVFTTPSSIEWSGYDLHTNAALALQNLQVFLNSVTPETTSSPRSAASPEAVPPVTPSSDRWDQLAQCESGGNWHINTGNGFGGGLQFMHQNTYSTWLSFGGDAYAPHPWEASREQQIAIAEKVLASSGWKAWPGCARRMGLL